MLHYLKYLILLGMVVLMPLFVVDSFGFSEPYFCKLVCPAGTLEGGLLLPILQPDLRGMLGKLFAWKVSLLVLLIGLMTMFRRPFCNWLCPLGAWFGPFNRISLYRLEFDGSKCVQCGLCVKSCPSGLDPVRECDSADCIRCLDCGRICPKQAIAVRGPGLSSAATSRSADAVPPAAPGNVR